MTGSRRRGHAGPHSEPKPAGLANRTGDHGRSAQYRKAGILRDGIVEQTAAGVGVDSLRCSVRHAQKGPCGRELLLNASQGATLPKEPVIRVLGLDVFLEEFGERVGTGRRLEAHARPKIDG